MEDVYALLERLRLRGKEKTILSHFGKKKGTAAFLRLPKRIR